MAGTGNEQVSLCIDNRDRVLFDAARSTQRESLAEFLIESGRQRAERLLADRTSFVLSSEDWKTFTAALDGPVKRHPEIAELFRRPPPA
jgi:uncharacterized protein (DUF1778 family)